MLKQAPQGTAQSQKVCLASAAKKGHARAIPQGKGHRGHGRGKLRPDSHFEF